MDPMLAGADNPRAPIRTPLVYICDLLVHDAMAVTHDDCAGMSATLAIN